ncbi:spore gernimation protein [Brevibacillus choshinensis]|uniref:Spore gernimation protein n=1 Tax=Brevibacillus choshinensis TaxID=54911 RepID=A0ABR5N735_BRECH|nr:Ger(x)C family spore germination protein [Brevibacillus choshinensis]KQL46199.1 spore gernimation protein [Brevibacillus choshinensis]
MRRRLIIMLLTILIVFLSGCYDRMDLEDATLTLMIGLDVDDKDNLIVYMSSPVFSKEAKEKSEEFAVKTKTLRQSRSRFDSMVTALTVAGKVQVILLGKRLLQHPDWFSLLDVMFRDAKFTVNASVVAIDGKLSEVFTFHPKDKPRLSLHLTKLIDTAHERNITVKTSVQELHRQMYEKGMTPSLTLMKKEKQMEIKGTALLTEKGTYATMVRLKENVLLELVQRGVKGEMSLTIPIREKEKKQGLVKPRLSFFVKKASTKIKPTYDGNRFHFDVKMKINVAISERLFSFDVKNEHKRLEKIISDEMKKEIESLLKKCQKHKVDPVGFGIYARAYQYEAYKQVENDWTKAFSQADIKVSVETIIKGNGIVK